MTGMEAASLPPPKFEYDCGGIRVTFYRNPDLQSHSGESSGESSGEILELMRQHPNITAAQLAKQLGLTERAIEKRISKLRHEKFIDRIGSNKGGHWVVLRGQTDKFSHK